MTPGKAKRSWLAKLMKGRRSKEQEDARDDRDDRIASVENPINTVVKDDRPNPDIPGNLRTSNSPGPKSLKSSTTASTGPSKQSSVERPRKDFWEIAYQSMSEDEQSSLNALRYRRGNGSISAVLDDTITTVEAQFEIRQLKDNSSSVRRATKAILDAAFSAKEIIAGITAVDPTGHASSAWAVVSLGLKIAQNDRELQDALFDACEFLTGILARYTVVDSLVRQAHVDTVEIMEQRIVRLYAQILRYVIEMSHVKKSSAAERIWAGVSALGSAGPNLESYRTEIEEEDQIMNQESQLSKLGRHAVSQAVSGIWASRHEDDCFKGTRERLLQDVVDWVDDPVRPQLFWLNGMAGTGKSTISRTLARYFRDRGILGGDFFFKKGEDNRDSPKKLVPTLVDRLKDVFPVLRDDIQTVIEEHPMIFEDSLKSQFDLLFMRPLQKLPARQRPSLVFILDAIDECRDSRDIEKLLGAISDIRAMEEWDLRFFITGRPEPAVREGFDELEVNQYQEVRLDQFEGTERDIAAFLGHALSKIRERERKKRKPSIPDDWPGERIIRQLTKMADPLFIAASTICRFIGDRAFSPVIQLDKIVKHRDPYNTLANIYQTILDQMIFDKTAKDRAEILQDFQRIVGSIVLLYDPLSVTSLAMLLDVEEDLVDRRLELLRSVLAVPDEIDAPIRTLHLSFRDYLIDPKGSEESPFNINTVARNHDLVNQCIRIMSDNGTA
ncbi:uncharacterized protein BDV14DRAFT_201791 [Aspergillus stella-maris]|uniref:uncharacterized protein n=1 Tax=Aspergillus stella-maris TaxID=1810926 RepID=UPI003CCDFBEF